VTGRRAFITAMGAAALAPLVARAQQFASLKRVGIIVEGMRSAAYDGFLQGMDELGHVAGRTFLIDWRFADGRYLRTLEIVSEFSRMKIDVIFVGDPSIIYPVRQATHAIPIVMGYSTDPVGSGFVTSLSRPGGNITGVASSGEDSAAKQLQLLGALVPDLSRVALMQNPENPNYASVLQIAMTAARSAGLDLVPLEARDQAEIDDAFRARATDRFQAVIVSNDRFFLTQQQRIADLALKRRLASMFSERAYVEAGGLMSLGDSLKNFYRRAAGYVDKIFKGARPADLPIERLSMFDLVINRKTAKLLGIALPVRTDVSSYEEIN
jgi:putative ABC transport system substrate-binding protein